MLKEILTYLTTRVSTTGYFSEVYSYAELKAADDGRLTPKMYCGKGEWKDITSFDSTTGTAYFRTTRAVRTSTITNTYVSGEVLLSRSYGFRLVAVIPNTKLNIDDEYKGARVVTDLMKAINLKVTGMQTILNCRRMTITPIAEETSSALVIQSELVHYKDRFEYTFVYIDFDVVVEIPQSCIVDSCDNTVTDCDVLLAALTRNEKITCVLPWYDFTDNEIFGALTNQQITDLTNRLCP